MFTPRTTKAISVALLAKVLARTKLTDTSLGSVLERLMWSYAEDISTTEQRIAAVRDSFDFLNPAISDADLDERSAEFPPDAGMQRLDSNNATGAVMSVTRKDNANVQILPAKTVFARSVDGVRYRTTQDYQFDVGVSTISNVSVICLVSGEQGNCEAGAINQLVGSPAWVISVANTAAITNGVEAETKQEYQVRLSKYVQSLAHSQMAALEFAASTYQAGNGARVKFARGYQDNLTPGMSYMILDDGTGMQGMVKAGATTTGVAPEFGIRQLWHEAPATGPILQIDVALPGGAHKTLIEGQDYVSIYERGIILLANGVVPPGSTWTISGYNIRTGLFGDVQRLLDGNPAKPDSEPGWVAAGCRCIVRPPDVVNLFCDIHVVPQDGFPALDMAQQAQSLAIAFLQQLGPGETMFTSRLISALMGITGMQAVHVYQPQTNIPLGDLYVSPTSVVRGTTGTISYIPTLP